MQNASQDSEFSRLRGQANLSLEDLSELFGFSVRTLYRWDRGESQPRRVALQFLHTVVADGRSKRPEQPTFRFIDLFAGIGGLRRGFETLGGGCVYTSEWDRFAKRTYLANFDCDHAIAGDITKVDVGEIPEHDVLLAGFPCQPFSIAGVSKKNALNKPHGFLCDAQGTLFFDVARIIEARRPRAFLLENVKNLVNHDKGRTFRIIHQTLTEDLGYQVHWKVVDAKSWVPQHRERIFVVGFREPNGFTFDDLEVPDPVTGPRLVRCCTRRTGPRRRRPRTFRVRRDRSPTSTRFQITCGAISSPTLGSTGPRAMGSASALSAPSDISRTLSARYYKDGSEILVRRDSGNPRRLTPRECARLMGFDRPGGRGFAIPVSDTQAYRQFGNAVVVPCVEAVARLMAPWLDIPEPDGMPFRQRRLPLHG